ncbi:hypothetical protein [Alkalicoccobacillus porphyridii]|uniref:DUF3953 domain-containing protein n=1 Tax=Alkalicoccobacillus porphyridii TaxID=2597270 RepID=A0A553ZVP7_9BACI|nr:hypothetical protein [Alkalicoccobacillus porphyridii]TSB45544.1 hypothetical protein FN960_15350 [Alkalicoccobacillus porphyridii]
MAKKSLLKVMSMEQQVKSKRLGITSIALMFLSMFLFYTQLIVDAGLYTEIAIYGGLSIAGILFAIYAGKLTKRSKLFILGVAGNSFMLFISAFLFVISIMVESQ